MSRGDTQHFVRTSVEVQKRMNAVAPALAPAIRGENRLEPRRRIGRAPGRQHVTIDDHRKPRVIGRLAVIVETEGVDIVCVHREELHTRLLRFATCRDFAG